MPGKTKFELIKKKIKNILQVTNPNQIKHEDNEILELDLEDGLTLDGFNCGNQFVSIVGSDNDEFTLNITRYCQKTTDKLLYALDLEEVDRFGEVENEQIVYEVFRDSMVDIPFDVNDDILQNEINQMNNDNIAELRSVIKNVKEE